MDLSENKKRVIDLLWRNYDTQISATRRYADRITVVLGATVAAIGLAVKFSEANVLSHEKAIVAFAICLCFLVLCHVKERG